MPTIETWVRDAPMPESVQIALSELHPALVAARADLAPGAWDHLASNCASDASVMEPLAARALDEARLAQILTRKGQRAAVLLAAISHNAAAITDELVARIPKVTAKVAAALCELTQLDQDVRYDLARTASGITLADTVWSWITPGVEDRRALELLTDADSWWPKRPSVDANRLASAVFELSPGVADKLCADTDLVGDRILMTVAGSHRLAPSAAEALAPRIAALTGERAMYTQMAFAANPRVPIDVAEVATTHPQALSTFRYRRDRRGSRHLEVAVCDTDDVDLLKWVVGRTLPTERKPSGRPWCAPDIVASPAFAELGEDHMKRIGDMAISAVAVPEAVARHCAELLGRTDELVAPAPQREDGPDDSDDLVEVDLGTVKPSQLTWMPELRRRATLGAIADRLGDDATTWTTFIELVDGFGGTVDEAIDLAVTCE